MYLVSKESNRKCRRSSDLKKLTYADGRQMTDKLVSDKLRLTKVSGAKNRNPFIAQSLLGITDRSIQVVDHIYSFELDVIFSLDW